MSTYSCDYDAVRDYKQGKNKDKVLSFVWSKYQPLIKSVVAKYFNYKQQELEFEDCMHNCFLLFPHVIEKQNLRKVMNKELWSLSTSLKMYLKSYTKSDMNRSIGNYWSGVYTSTYEESEEGYEGIRVPSGLHSKDTVEGYINTTVVNQDMNEIIKNFYTSCSDSHKLLMKVCIERYSTSDKRPETYYVNLAKGIKKGYAKSNQGKYKNKKDTISRQYYHQEVAKLKRGFISYMQQYGYYSPESLRQMGLEKLI